MGPGETLSMGRGRAWAQDGLFLIDQEVVGELRMLTFQQTAWQASGECFVPFMLCISNAQRDPSNATPRPLPILPLPGIV